jgi:glycosyltransferase involved in cell wall biosynthesis
MATVAAARNDVEVVATSYGTPQERQDPGRIWEYEDGGAIYRLFPYRGARWGFSPSLARWLRTEAARYDVLHVHAPFGYPTRAACAAARRRGIPYVYRTLGTLDPWSLQQRAWKKWAYYRLVVRRDLRTAAIVHVMSETEREAVAALGFGARARVVPYGIALPAAVHRAPHTTTRLLFVGRLDPIKALPVLLRAVAMLRTSGQGAVQLDIAGGGPDAYRGELEVLARSLGVETCVRFLGFVHGDAKARLLAESDVFVLPSYHENFGIAVVAGMAAGLPAIVSSGVALAQEIHAAEAGVMVAAGDATVLAEALRRMQDPLARAEAGERARGLVGRRFTIEVMRDALEEMYRGAIDGSISRPSDVRHTNARAQ